MRASAPGAGQQAATTARLRSAAVRLPLPLCLAGKGLLLLPKHFPPQVRPELFERIAGHAPPYAPHAPHQRVARIGFTVGAPRVRQKIVPHVPGKPRVRRMPSLIPMGRQKRGLHCVGHTRPEPLRLRAKVAWIPAPNRPQPRLDQVAGRPLPSAAFHSASRSRPSG
jgi:hypothetical protein